MCRVIAVSNQKGGVGKTVSCVNLGIGLATIAMAVDLSYLDEQVQKWVYEYFKENGFLKPVQVEALKNYASLYTGDCRQLAGTADDRIPDP